MALLDLMGTAKVPNARQEIRDEAYPQVSVQSSNMVGGSKVI